MDFEKFDDISFDAERLDEKKQPTGIKVRAHKFAGGLVTPVEIRLPSRHGERQIKKRVVTPPGGSDGGKLTAEVESTEKFYDWEAGEHYHGGCIRVRFGDYIIRDESGAFFALGEKSFSECFRKV